MKYIRDDGLDEVLAIVGRTNGYTFDIIDDNTRKKIDTTISTFKPQDYKVVEIRMNDLLMKYELYVVKKEN